MAPHILYIEDNPDNMMLVRRILMAEGLEMTGATSATEGIKLAVELKPDLILVDINMPDIDGLTATSRLRQSAELSNVPIVALTANVMRTVLDQAMEVGCNGYIAKPIDVDQFTDQIYAYLRE